MVQPYGSAQDDPGPDPTPVGLQVTPPECLQFVMSAEAASACTSEVLQMYKREIVRLSDELQLAEDASRREFMERWG